MERQPLTPTGKGCGSSSAALHKARRTIKRDRFLVAVPRRSSANWTVEQKSMPPSYSSSHLLQRPRITGDPREPLSTPRQAASSLGPSSSTVFLPCLHFIRFSLLMPSALCLANPYLLVQNCPQRFTTGNKISLGISSLITLAQNASVGFLCIYRVCVCVCVCV